MNAFRSSTFPGVENQAELGVTVLFTFCFAANLDPPVRHQLKNRCVPWKSKKTVPVECVSLISVMRNISKLVFLFTRDVTAPSSFLVVCRQCLPPWSSESFHAERFKPYHQIRSKCNLHDNCSTVKFHEDHVCVHRSRIIHYLIRSSDQTHDFHILIFTC